jgi:drug/metabolite transporter (DMT)-like permease
MKGSPSPGSPPGSVSPDGSSAAAAIAVRARTRAKGVSLAVVSAITFSTLGLFAKLAYSQGMSPSQALAWRFSLAGLVLWIILCKRGGHRRPFRDYRDILLLGLLGFSPQAGLYFLAVQYLDPGIASLLLYLYPAFVVGLGFLFFGKRPRKAQLLALAASLAGCVLTLWTRGVYPAIGYVFGLAVAISYAVYLVVADRVLSRLDPIFSTANIMASAALVYWVVTLANGSFLLPTTPAAIAGIVGIAVIGSIIPIVTLFASIRLIGSADYSLVSTIEPLFTVILSAVLLGERLTAMQFAGGAFILTGVLVLNLRASQHQPS